MSEPLVIQSIDVLEPRGHGRTKLTVTLVVESPSEIDAINWFLTALTNNRVLLQKYVTTGELKGLLARNDEEATDTPISAGDVVEALADLIAAREMKR